MTRRIPASPIRRLSHYLRSLEDLARDGGDSGSSEERAERGQTTAAQVRKDLSHFGSFGKRGLGYKVEVLRDYIREILGVDRIWNVALIGAGRIGAALFEYPDFGSRGYKCVAIIDSDQAKIGTRWGDLQVRSPDDLQSLITDLGVELIVLAVPAQAAQEVAERAVKAGVKGILNFAPIRLKVPSEVHVEDVNLVMQLEAVSFAITQRTVGA